MEHLCHELLPHLLALFTFALFAAFSLVFGEKTDVFPEGRKVVDVSQLVFRFLQLRLQLLFLLKHFILLIASGLEQFSQLTLNLVNDTNDLSLFCTEKDWSVKITKCDC